MSGLRTLIIENTPGDVKELKQNIVKYGSSHFHSDFISVAVSFGEGMDVLSKSFFDITILDCKLGDSKHCFQLLKEHLPERFGILVVCTGYKDDFIVRGVRDWQTVWYSKPFSEQGTLDFIEELEGKLGCVYDFENNGFKLRDGQIVYIEQNGNSAKLYYKQYSSKFLNEIIIHKPLYKIEELLNPEVFVRCANSRIINIKFIRGYRQNRQATGGTLYTSFIKSDGNRAEILYSKTYKEKLKNRGALSIPINYPNSIT